MTYHYLNKYNINMILYNTCCVFGHRDMIYDENDRELLYNLFEDMIVSKNIYIFLFGGFGDFDDFCHEIITELKKKYPHIKRVYVCEFYKYIEKPSKRPAWIKDEDYEAFEYYEMNYTGFYKRIYFRNCEIIDHSDICVFCVDETAEYSGAKKALEYAKKKHKGYINVYNNS